MSKKNEHENAGPLGNPERQGRGEAQPEGAGAEGGLGFLGDQRGEDEDALPELEVNNDPGKPITPVKK
jgi:hypothetical protein